MPNQGVKVESMNHTNEVSLDQTNSQVVIILIPFKHSKTADFLFLTGPQFPS